jgi:hypothetical protein
MQRRPEVELELEQRRLEVELEQRRLEVELEPRNPLF